MSDAPYQSPGWIKLLFAPLSEILAAPEADREAYYAFVNAFTDNPEACGFRYETGDDIAADFAKDRFLDAVNQDVAR